MLEREPLRLKTQEKQDAAFNSDQYLAAYPEGFQNHYWYKSRNQILLNEIKKMNIRAPNILDVGCGRGHNVSFFRQNGLPAWGVDIAEGPVLAEVATYIRTNMDARNLSVEMKSSVTCISLLDVLEHIEKPVAFLADLKSQYPNLKRLLITVPAGPELISNLDTFYGHFRRYTITDLKAELALAGFEFTKVSYMYRLLYLPARLELWLKSKRNYQITAPKTKWFHALIAKILYYDYLFLPRVLRGTSIIGVAVPKTAVSRVSFFLENMRF